MSDLLTNYDGIGIITMIQWRDSSFRRSVSSTQIQHLTKVLGPVGCFLFRILPIEAATEYFH